MAHRQRRMFDDRYCSRGGSLSQARRQVTSQHPGPRSQSVRRVRRVETNSNTVVCCDAVGDCSDGDCHNGSESSWRNGRSSMGRVHRIADRGDRGQPARDSPAGATAAPTGGSASVANRHGRGTLWRACGAAGRARPVTRGMNALAQTEDKIQGSRAPSSRTGSAKRTYQAGAFPLSPSCKRRPAGAPHMDTQRKAFRNVRFNRHRPVSG
jgi:hypothetical protein